MEGAGEERMRKENRGKRLSPENGIIDFCGRGEPATRVCRYGWKDVYGGERGKSMQMHLSGKKGKKQRDDERKLERRRERAVKGNC